MKTTKLNFLKSTNDIFYKIIYPVYAKEFLFSDNYENFALLVETKFILNPIQWDYILEHWIAKENLLQS